LANPSFIKVKMLAYFICVHFLRYNLAIMKLISTDQTIILAKTRHIEELERLSHCTSFVETIGLIIHQMQAERGASCLYLASRAQRFANERALILEQNLCLEQKFAEALQRHLQHNTLADAKQLTLISWILLGFEQLKSLRYQVTLLKISFPDCIQSFNRLIGSLIALIFEIIDNTVNSKISTYLLALYNLVQGKEFAGQERAFGAYILGSGSVQQEHQHKLLELIALQDRHFELFCQFGSDHLQNAWQALINSETCQLHQRFRKKLTSAHVGQSLQRKEADQWFDLCSQRLTEIWHIQCLLISTIHDALETLVIQAKQNLESTRKQLQQLRQQPSKNANLDSTFFNLNIPVEKAYTFLNQDGAQPYPIESMIALLQQQSQQIAEMESELTDTKKALAERKQIERAKGLLMTTLNISEVEAYKWLRSTAMQQNRKIIDVAESILAHQSLG
jgi:hypothetical protein